MRNFCHHTATCILGGLVFLVAPTPAHAYIDPGTGSLMLQAFIGAVAGGMVALHLYWSKVKRLFRQWRTENARVVDNAQTGDELRDQNKP